MTGLMTGSNELFSELTGAEANEKESEQILISDLAGGFVSGI